MVLHCIVSCRDNSVVCCILIKFVVRTFCQPCAYITSTTNHGSILLKIPNHNTDTLNRLLLWQFWSTASSSLSTIHLKRLSKCVRQSFLCVSLDVFCPFLSAVLKSGHVSNRTPVGVLRYMGYCPNHKMRLSADLPPVEPELLEMENRTPLFWTGGVPRKRHLRAK